MLTLHLYPDDVTAMLSFLSRYVYVENQPLAQQRVNGLVLLQYLRTWPLSRIHSWEKKRFDRSYKLNLPTLAAVTLFDELTSRSVTVQQQVFLDKLSEGIMNHKVVHTIQLS